MTTPTPLADGLRRAQSGPGLVIRRALPADAPTVRGFVLAELVARGTCSDSEDPNVNIARFGSQRGAKRIDLVAEVNGKVIGSATLTPARTDVALSTLNVVPEMRRRGIARALVNRAIDEARAADFRCIEMHVRADQRTASALCESGGWERRAHESDGGPTRNRIYYLPLQTA